MKVRASQCVGHLCHGCDEILVCHLSLTTEDFVCFFFFCQVLGRNASLNFFMHSIFVAHLADEIVLTTKISR